MNCNTGEITNDPRLRAQWESLGVPVMELPGEDTPDTYTTPAVVTPQETPDKRLARALNNRRLEILCGKRR